MSIYSKTQSYTESLLGCRSTAGEDPEGSADMESEIQLGSDVSVTP